MITQQNSIYNKNNLNFSHLYFTLNTNYQKVLKNYNNFYILALNLSSLGHVTKVKENLVSNLPSRHNF